MSFSRHGFLCACTTAGIVVVVDGLVVAGGLLNGEWLMADGGWWFLWNMNHDAHLM